jgi:hypothetical protein
MNLKPTVEWLKDDLGFNETQVRKLLVSCPSILGYSIEMNLKPTVRWLKDDLDFNETQVLKVLVATPHRDESEAYGRLVEGRPRFRRFTRAEDVGCNAADSWLYESQAYSQFLTRIALAKKMLLCPFWRIQGS